MKTKFFDGKKIIIREFSKKDLRNVRKFQTFINSLIEEEALINLNKKLSMGQEKKWLEEQLRKMKSHKSVYLIAETNNMVVGTTQIYLNEGRGEHVGNFGITIRKGYRGIGLGSYLTDEVIKLAKKKLKPKPKIIFYSDNTEVDKFVSGTSNDLEIGKTVIVTGTANQDGSVTAQSIQIRPAVTNFSQ